MAAAAPRGRRLVRRVGLDGSYGSNRLPWRPRAVRLAVGRRLASRRRGSPIAGLLRRPGPASRQVALAGGRLTTGPLRGGSSMSSSGGRACRDRVGAGRCAERSERARRSVVAGRSMPCLRLGRPAAVSGSPRRPNRPRRTTRPSPPGHRSAAVPRLRSHRPGRRRARGVRTLLPHRVVPARHADQQHGGRGEQHERESLDQRVAAVDQGVLEAGELRAVEQGSRRPDGDEQEQGWLDDRGEDPGVPYRQHGHHASRTYSTAKTPPSSLTAAARVEREANRGEGHRNQDRGPPRYAGKIRVRGAMIGCHRRSGPLC